MLSDQWVVHIKEWIWLIVSYIQRSLKICFVLKCRSEILVECGHWSAPCGICEVLTTHHSCFIMLRTLHSRWQNLIVSMLCCMQSCEGMLYEFFLVWIKVTTVQFLVCIYSIVPILPSHWLYTCKGTRLLMSGIVHCAIAFLRGNHSGCTLCTSNWLNSCKGRRPLRWGRKQHILSLLYQYSCSVALPILLHFAEVHHYFCSISIFQHHFYCSSAVFRYHYYCSIIVFQNHFYCSISEFKYHYYCSITVFQNHFYGSISIFQCHYYCNMRKCTTTTLAVFWSYLHSSTTYPTQHHRVLQLKAPSTFMQLTHHHFKHCKYMAGICSEFSINH